MKKAFKIPILPHTAPVAEQPHNMKLPLYPHQLRALNRCLVIERDGSLSSDFGNKFDYTSRGGCLADAVGTGKTATIIGLVLSGDVGNNGDTLVVAPTHLIPQWKYEIEKFAGNSIQVIVGKNEYERFCSTDPPPYIRRIVLVDVDSILNESKLYYDWRTVYRQRKKDNRLVQVHVSTEKMKLYKEAALYCVKSPKGPCSYEGWVYTGSLHMPQRPWRRVIYDEIQDLVAEGTESQKNLLQLSRTSTHVWLLSATPFPHGNSSVYANHELLGFNRLRLDVDVDYDLPTNHTFEIIKRKLYIRSPPHVADQAVNPKKAHKTIHVTQLDLEQRFYKLEEGNIKSTYPSTNNMFNACFNPLREMAVHPEASEALRTAMVANSSQYNNITYVPQVSATVNDAAKRAIRIFKQELADCKRNEPYMAKHISGTERSIDVAKAIQKYRNKPVKSNIFAAGPAAGENSSKKKQDEEAKLIHDQYCSCPTPNSSNCSANKNIFFRIIREKDSYLDEFISGKNSLQKVIEYFQHDLHTENEVNIGNGCISAMKNYISVTQRTLQKKIKALQNIEKTKKDLENRIQTLSSSLASSNKTGKQQQHQQEYEKELFTQKFGSKPAALVRYLDTVVNTNGEKVIVFSYWHDTLKLIYRTLKKCGLNAVFCSGSKMTTALHDFTSGDVPIILLSAKSKASGANLQCATQVILLDPAGSSAEHGATLEEQAIGRAVRMGQEKPVTVTRFCVKETIEEELFEEIDCAAIRSKERADDPSYVIKDSNKTAAPTIIRKKVDAPDENLDVKFTESISAEENLHRKFQIAMEQGNVIDMIDDSDEEHSRSNANISTITPQPKVSVTKETTSSVKRSMDSDEHSSCDRDVKRVRTVRKTMKSKEVRKSLQSLTTTPRNQDSLGSINSPTVSESDESDANDDKYQALRSLLKRLDLEEYFDVFINQGYDNVEWLYEIAGKRTLLEKIVTKVEMKPGHSDRFITGLAKEAGF